MLIKRYKDTRQIRMYNTIMPGYFGHQEMAGYEIVNILYRNLSIEAYKLGYRYSAREF